MMKITLTLAIVVAGCGSSPHPTSADAGTDTGAIDMADGGANGCTVTITGTSAFSGPCNVQVLYTAMPTQVELVISSLPIFYFDAILSNANDYSARTYSIGNIVSAEGGYVDSTTGAEWDLSIPVGGPNVGTFSLVVSSIGPSVTANGGMEWLMSDGSLSDTMLPKQGTAASGMVQAQVTF